MGDALTKEPEGARGENVLGQDLGLIGPRIDLQFKSSQRCAKEP